MTVFINTKKNKEHKIYIKVKLSAQTEGWKPNEKVERQS